MKDIIINDEIFTLEEGEDIDEKTLEEISNNKGEDN